MGNTAEWAEDQKARGRTLIAVDNEDIPVLVDWLKDQGEELPSRLRASLEGAEQAASVPETEQVDTLVMLQGGHKTVVRGASPEELEKTLRQFKEAQASHGPVKLMYLQTPQFGDNGLCIHPDSIVALVAINHH